MKILRLVWREMLKGLLLAWMVTASAIGVDRPPALRLVCTNVLAGYYGVLISDPQLRSLIRNIEAGNRINFGNYTLSQLTSAVPEYQGRTPIEIALHFRHTAVALDLLAFLSSRTPQQGRSLDSRVLPFPQAQGPSNGANLLVPARAHRAISGYQATMALAVNRMVTALGNATRFDTATVASQFHRIGRRRASVERRETRERFQLELPESLDETAPFILRLGYAYAVRPEGTPAEHFNHPVGVYDPILPNDPYYRRLRNQLGIRRTIVIGGVQRGLSHCSLSHEDIVSINHPSYAQMVPIRQHGYRLIAEVLNNRSLSESEVIEKVALAHYLLIQAPPRLRGTAATTLAFIDAVLRHRLGVRLPQVREGIVVELEALSLSPQDFVANYRLFFQ